MIKSISFVVLIQFFNFLLLSMKILMQPGYFI